VIPDAAVDIVVDGGPLARRVFELAHEGTHTLRVGAEIRHTNARFRSKIDPRIVTARLDANDKVIDEAKPERRVRRLNR